MFLELPFAVAVSKGKRAELLARLKLELLRYAQTALGSRSMSTGKGNSLDVNVRLVAPLEMPVGAEHVHDRK